MLHSAILVETREGVSLSQAARPFQTFTIRFFGGSPGEVYFLFNGPGDPEQPPIMFDAIQMGPGNSEGTVSWKEDVGLELNYNAGSHTNKDYIFPPRKYTIVATTEFNSWNNKRYREVTLEYGNISVSLP